MYFLIYQLVNRKLIWILKFLALVSNIKHYATGQLYRKQTFYSYFKLIVPKKFFHIYNEVFCKVLSKI